MSHRSIRSLTVVAAGAAVCAFTVPAADAAAGGNSAAAHACQQGGYAYYIDPSTGTPFTNQGACVSNAAQGGTLVPVPPTSVVLRYAPTGSPNYCTVFVDIQGATPNTQYTGGVLDPYYPTTYPLTITTDGLGNGTGSIGSYYNAATLTATVDGVSSAPEHVSC